MKRFRPLRLAALAAFFSVVLVSCGPTARMKVQDVQLGMTKQQVISKMGNQYDVASLRQTEQGNVEILRYTHSEVRNDVYVPVSSYYFHFLNGKLVEMHNEDILPQPVRPPHPRPH